MSPRAQPPRRPARLVLALTALLLPLMLTACEPSDTEFLVEIGLEYAQEKGILNEDGSPNMLTMGAYLLGGTGDPEVDAALDAGMVVRSLEDADRLAQEGAEEGDPSKIQAAINSRPGDWSYREQHAALLLSEGNLEDAEASFSESDRLIEERLARGAECSQYRLNQLRHREQAILTQMQRNPTDDDVLNRLDPVLNQTSSEIEALQQGQPTLDCP